MSWRAPDPPRDAGLPGDFKELSEVFERQQQNDTALKKVAADVALQGQRLAPLIFARLRRHIDEDLLYTDQAELVMPEIAAMSAKVLGELSPGAPSTRFDSWMVGIISREVHEYIQRRRPKL